VTSNPTTRQHQKAHPYKSGSRVEPVPLGHSTPCRYEIRIRGLLPSNWSTWVDGFAVQPAGDGTTLITGQVPDQAALHGVLQALRELGLPLLAVTQAPQQLAADALPQHAYGLPQQEGAT
jgi:hypothetical protein